MGQDQNNEQQQNNPQPQTPGAPPPADQSPPPGGQASGGQAPPPGGQQPVAGGMSIDTWNMLCHLIALSAIVTGWIGAIVGPLVIWLIKKDEMPSVDYHGKKALNFNISVAIYMVVASVLIVAIIGFLLVPAVFIFWLVFVIKASVDANNGKDVSYPLTIQFMK